MRAFRAAKRIRPTCRRICRWRRSWRAAAGAITTVEDARGFITNVVAGEPAEITGIPGASFQFDNDNSGSKILYGSGFNTVLGAATYAFAAKNYDESDFENFVAKAASFRCPVYAIAADKAMDNVDSNGVIWNSGTTQYHVLLPFVPTGVLLRFASTNTGGFRIGINDSDTVYFGTQAITNGAMLACSGASATGASLTLLGLDNNTYVVLDASGTWAVHARTYTVSSCTWTAATKTITKAGSFAAGMSGKVYVNQNPVAGATDGWYTISSSTTDTIVLTTEIAATDQSNIKVRYWAPTASSELAGIVPLGGTVKDRFQIDADNSGPIVKAGNATLIQLRNAADSAGVNLAVADFWAATLQQFSRKIISDTAPGTSDSGTVHCESAAIARTLPTAVAGFQITIINEASSGNVDIAPASGDVIVGPGVSCDSAHVYRTSTQYSTVTLVARDATTWVIVAETGTWAVV